MSLRYLFGPVPKSFAEQKLHGPRQAGQCLTFHAEEKRAMFCCVPRTPGRIC